MNVNKYIEDGRFQYRTDNYVVTVGKVPAEREGDKEFDGYLITNLHTGIIEGGTTSMPEALRMAEQFNSMLEEDFHEKFRVSRLQSASEDVLGMLPGGNG